LIKLLAVPPASINAIWPRLDSVYEEACSHTPGMLTKESIKARALGGDCTIWIAADSADTEVTATCVTSEVLFPGGLRSLFVEILGGKIKYDIFDFRATLEKWAKDRGCASVVFMVPRRWAKRLPDYDMGNVIMFKDIIRD
jgi:hypothetical protein